TGSGTLILNGANSSGLVVQDGKAIVNGTQTGVATVQGSVAATSATLGGTGTVAGISLRNGKVNPGLPGQTGILTTSNGLTASASGVAGATRRFEVDLNSGLVAGT